MIETKLSKHIDASFRHSQSAKENSNDALKLISAIKSADDKTQNIDVDDINDFDTGDDIFNRLEYSNLRKFYLRCLEMPEDKLVELFEHINQQDTISLYEQVERSLVMHAISDVRNIYPVPWDDGWDD